MTTAIGTTAPVTSAITPRSDAVQNAKGGTTESVAATVLSGDAQPFSPRWRNDPQVGLILEYLGDKGAVVQQTPSQTVVAYLRAGLTEQGVKEPSATSLLSA